MRVPIKTAAVSKLFHVIAALGVTSLLLYGACGGSGVDGAGKDHTGEDDALGATDATRIELDSATADVEDTLSSDNDDTADVAVDTNSYDAPFDPPDSDVPLDEPTLVRIVTPINGADVKGAITVRLEPVGVDEREVDEVSLEVNGEPIFWDVKLPTELVLDTRDLGVVDFDLTARARAGFERGSHRIRVSPDNAPMRFTEVTPGSRVVKNGDYINVSVALSSPAAVQLEADFSAIDSAYDPSRVTASPSNGTYYIIYPLSAGNTKPDGDYLIPIKATFGNFQVTYSQLTLSLRNGATNPVTVKGAIYVDDALPQPATNFVGDKPILTLSNTTILTGGSSTLNIDFLSAPAPRDIVGVIFGIEGSNGYWQIPVDMTKPGALAKVDASFVLRAFRSFETVPARLALRIALRDVRGRVSPYAAKQVEVLQVGTGDVQVSLSWDKNQDMDLHVRSPNGCEIYYGHKQCNNGGELDLDSNPGCYIDGVNNENVFWPEGDAPTGTYRVYVDYYEQCVSSVPTHYTVTVTYCNRIETYDGVFNSGTDDGGGALSGRHIIDFDVGQCSRTARGKVRYQDRTFDKTGFGAYSWQTLEGARVELRHLQTQQVVAAGTTDRDGNYEIGFPSTNIPGLVVAVLARTDPEIGLRDIQVYDHPKFDKLYEVTSNPIILYPDTVDVVQDVDIRVDQFAGAFNIFDTLRKAYDGVRLQNGRELGELKAYWKTGTDTTDTFFCSERLYDEGVCTEVNTVSVQGKETDRDEYDDMVIIKEFFKFALGKTSRDSHPGGTVDGRRDDARKAWTEGVAEFFAADVTGSRYYVNSRPYGVTLVDDLEVMNTPFAYGVKTDGYLSHWLVAALLWDLADPANESWDEVDSKRNGIYDVLFSYFPSDQFVDRGVAGCDLDDFLDGWVCRGWGDATTLQSSLDHYEDDYSFDGPAACTGP